MKKKITRSEYLQICGLLELANASRKALNLYYKSLRNIIQEKDEYGHASDFVYSEGGSAEELLEKTGIKKAFKDY